MPSHDKPAFDASTYWEQRHRKCGTSLRSVGHINLSDADNAADYAVKLQHMISAIARSGALKGKAILDAGGGIGLLAEAMIDEGAEVCVADISATAIANAKRRAPTAKFECRPIETLAYQAAFDVVVCMDVLHHVVDDAKWKRVLSRLGAAVKPGGVILIQETPAEMGDAPPHVRWRTLEDYRKALAEIGFRISDVESYDLPRQAIQKTILTVRVVP